MGKLYLGTSGYTYDDWKGTFYPPKTPRKAWLSYYAQQYNTVEINATFYRQFNPAVFNQWCISTPDEFRFAIKGPKTITHEKRLQGADEELRQFVHSVEGLEDKLAVILWQFPASVRRDDLFQTLTSFLAALPQTTRHVFEFRHRSWFTDEVYTLLEQHHAGMVIGDSSEFPSQLSALSDFVYIRLHGPEKLYDSTYTIEQLTVWAEFIKTHLPQRDVFCYFNNTMRGRAHENIQQLRDLLT